ILGEYQVVAADYDNYAVTWGCREMLNGMLHFQVMYLLGRRPQLEDHYINEAKRKARDMGLRTDGLFRSNYGCKENPGSPAEVNGEMRQMNNGFHLSLRR
ncbi:unnamed protein product, partial [Darwinula stevensoni]